MRTIELARRLAEIGQKEDAQKGYFLALQNQEELTPKEELEASSYLLFSGWDHKLPLTVFVSLYNRGYFQSELIQLMDRVFYQPNVQKQQKRYARNCRALERYDYCFGKAFPAFEALPIQFFQFDDKGYIPFFKEEKRFGDYIDFNDPVIDRYFFKDLENPILAQDVYSRYQLEYLNDNVRKSEWVARDNHIYLHYTSWAMFCAYLQCLDFMPLLKEQKFVILAEEEVARYPIDFQAEFGIDYSQYHVKPVGVREVNRLIWHTQLSAHNGGDFFNEIFYDHPNLLTLESIMFETVLKSIKEQRKELKKYDPRRDGHRRVIRELAEMRHPTDKDLLVGMFLENKMVSGNGTGNERIAPAVFFQPHFSSMLYDIKISDDGEMAILESAQYEEIRNSPLFRQFKYIKTFSPMRRPTTSYGATIRFMWNNLQNAKEGDAEKETVVGDVLSTVLLNRSFMVDQWDRLYRDSVLVRFEDGKLNPKATFTALAEFLDIPYTESMTYCSGKTGLNPVSMAGNVLGFDTATVYRTYDEFADDDARCLLEYFLRDAYKEYGYQFQYYNEESVDMEWVKNKLKGVRLLDKYIIQSNQQLLMHTLKDNGAVVSVSDGETYQGEEGAELFAQKRVEAMRKRRLAIAELFLKNLELVNPQAQPLRFMKPLELDPALLEQPLYH